MKTKELRDQSVDELLAKAEDINRELFELKSKLGLEKKLDHPHLIKDHKRNRARILTILREKKVG